MQKKHAKDKKRDEDNKKQVSHPVYQHREAMLRARLDRERQ